MTAVAPRRFLTGPIAAIGLMLGMVVLSGCAAGIANERAIGSTPSSEPTNAPGLFTYEVTDDMASMQALASGELSFEDGCVRLGSDTILAFPDTMTRWDGTTLTYGDKEFEMGDPIGLGGGFIFEEGYGERPATIPDTCGPGSIFAVGLEGPVDPAL